MKKNMILLIGDSITEGFDEKKYLSGLNVLNLGISGDNTEKVLNRISPQWFKDNPGVAFLCIGTNDFACEKSDEFILNNISQIINSILWQSPEIKLVPVSIFPTRDNPPRPNERIVRFNKSLEKLASENNLAFFNIHSHFTDETGNLKSEYTGDGLHLTAKAYEVWASLIEDFLNKLSELH